VETQLRKAGALEGATVTIGDISFEWEPSLAGDPTLTSRGSDARLMGTDRTSAAERKRASQARRGLIDEYDFGDGEVADRDRWQG
jgi:GTP-binding protein